MTEMRGDRGDAVGMADMALGRDFWPITWTQDDARFTAPGDRCAFGRSAQASIAAHDRFKLVRVNLELRK